MPPSHLLPLTPLRLRRLWWILILSVFASYLVLLWGGSQIYQAKPPIPERVVDDSGRVLFTRRDILRGQSVWRAMGGQQVGSIWGHGAYQAPDWSGDWLHREALLLRQLLSQRRSPKGYEALSLEARAAVDLELRQEFRGNAMDPKTQTIHLSAARSQAVEGTQQHYDKLFGDHPDLKGLRESYALPESPIPDPEDRRRLTQFYWWTSWAAATQRPDAKVTYTNNWPYEPLVGNLPTPDMLFWSLASIFFLLAGIGALAWFLAAHAEDERALDPPEQDPLEGFELTASMKATYKYFITAALLFGLQVVCGVLTVHYTVEGQAFFGIPLARWLPYAVTRTWHIQLGIFWIATSFLATGLFLSPLLSGREPKGQKLGVDILFAALVLVVLGSLFGEWASVQGWIPLEQSFWIGHQGYEYVELGRLWQWALAGGLLLWLALMGRALGPTLSRRVGNQDLPRLLFLSSLAIGTLYGAGLMWGSETHLSVVEYWRWWVVHLWVEGFFEVFATATIALFFVRLGLLDPGRAAATTLFSTIIFLGGGVLGTFHHLYFSGTPVGIMALGSSFSAMEIVPLVLIGFEASRNLELLESRRWVGRYRGPIRFFLGVCFWNFVGAGLFGFLINPPIALYYMQGLNTTPVHGHTALFGVYGLLSLGLMLFCLRPMVEDETWMEGRLTQAFWGMNLGLSAMVLFSLLPIGLLQTKACLERGMWWARSAEFLQQPLLENLRWARILGDLLFVFGLVCLLSFLFKLRLRLPSESPLNE